MIADNAQAIGRDLEELASRGFNHPDASAIVGRVRVALEQIEAEAGAPAAPADPVQDQLAKLNLSVAALAEAVGPVLQRQQDVAHEIGIVSASVVRLTELIDAQGAMLAAVVAQTRPAGQ